jgi:hypothetical protein
MAPEVILDKGYTKAVDWLVLWHHTPHSASLSFARGCISSSCPAAASAAASSSFFIIFSSFILFAFVFSRVFGSTASFSFCFVFFFGLLVALLVRCRWALGVLTYELLCGSTPFRQRRRKNDDNGHVYRNILSGPIRCPPWLKG